ncbi:hypothetical protein NOI24_22465 [Neorhizobium galegae]|uniref:hypothetical protein n=1 Tax=Neorhizobium galegae TaxID=399 RepID=UPI0021039FF1|nr:hypothetical protein [Neorhizobium galegae]MCQ1774085.1 hypothetical protein [Neorhizobium galegae]MCQ1800134.1 hypothetical protein [Neorhizobium galegae]
MNDFPEFDNLPDDPEVAFVRLYERHNEEYQQRIRGEQDTRAEAVEFMNTMLGVAQGLEIPGFENWAIPEDWDEIYAVFTNFDRALKRYVMEVKVRKSRVTKVYSVHLNAEDKSRIHNLIREIRDILTSADLQDRKRNSLFNKLSAFEADVDRVRTRFDNATLMAIDIIGVVDKGTNTLKPINELLRRIQAIMGNAKDEEPEQNQLPAPTEPKKLPPPPKQITGPDQNPFSRDLDDDIPF